MLPPPTAFGLPDKYQDWRSNQDKAILQIADLEKRFLTQVAPTGSGKSLTYIIASLLQGKRTLILTGTKGLQTQLMSDFEEIGLTDVRGRNAYPCAYARGGGNCDHGPCIAGFKCPLREMGCHYFDAVKAATRARLVVTNYAYWMAANEYSEGIGKFDFMVCDEAHDVPDIVAQYLTVSFDKGDKFIAPFLPGVGSIYQMDLGAWKGWAESVRGKVHKELVVLKDTIKDTGGTQHSRRRFAKFQAFKKNLDIMRTMNEDNWVFDVGEYSCIFSPMWPAPYCESTLFLKTPTVLFTSASVRPKTMLLLGVDPTECDFTEYPHTFPKENRMLIHIKTVRMNYQTPPAGIQEWLRRIDQIIRGRLDRKGIIHTVSYDRRNKVITNSKYGEHMITHSTRTAEATVREFKASSPPLILVSPSMGTGWDFPGLECEYQIIGKLPYPDTTNKIVKARIKADKDYAAYVAMQGLVQTCGRGIRAADDRCENLIIDDSIEQWFMKNFKHFAPDWFSEAYVSRNTIPPPPKKMRITNENH